MTEKEVNKLTFVGLHPQTYVMLNGFERING